MKKKVAVAMSGGVDSGVTAALLVKQGYDCTGIHLKLIQNSKIKNQNLETARKTANKLGIDLKVLDLKEVFKEKVIDCFIEDYQQGLTPNPCVQCNKFIKFGQLYDYVRKAGFDYLATGHYSRIAAETKIGKLKIYRLLQAKDQKKDQSYFLYNLSQQHLVHLLFPVGDYLKTEVRAMAKNGPPAGGLPVAEKPESQEICFLAGQSCPEYLKKHLYNSIRPGEVVDLKGQVIGQHFGLPLYTIGQRHGFSTGAKVQRHKGASSIIPPYYVIKKNFAKNQLVVGFGKEAEIKEFWVKNVNIINDQKSLFEYPKIYLRVRHLGEFLKCKIQRSKIKNKVILEEPTRGIAPGQSAVFYKKYKDTYEVLGGGEMGYLNT